MAATWWKRAGLSLRKTRMCEDDVSLVPPPLPTTTQLGVGWGDGGKGFAVAVVMFDSSQIDGIYKANICNII